MAAEGAQAVALNRVLDAFGLSRQDAEAMIMQARLKAGWITEADLAPPEAEAAEAEAEAEPVSG